MFTSVTNQVQSLRIIVSSWAFVSTLLQIHWNMDHQNMTITSFLLNHPSWFVETFVSSHFVCISGSNVQKLQILSVSDNIFGMIAQSKNCWLIERHLHSTAGLVATTAFSCKNKIPSILYPPSNPRQINYVHCQCSDNLIWNLHQLFPRCAYFSAEKRGMQLRKIPKKTS